MKQGLMSIAICLSLGLVLPACGVQAPEVSSSANAVTPVPLQTLDQALSQDQQLIFIPPPNPYADLYAEIETTEGVLGVEIALEDPSQAQGLRTALWQPQDIAEFIAVDRMNELFAVPHPQASMHLIDPSQRTICSTRKLVADSMLRTNDGRMLAATLGIGIGLPGGGGCALRYSECVEKPCDILGLNGNCARGSNIFGWKACVCFVMAIETSK